MNRIRIVVTCAVLVFSAWAAAQAEFDTIYKYPDKKGEDLKVIRGIVDKETKSEVVYKIGMNQEKRIDAELVIKVVYAPRGGKALTDVREKIVKGMAEYEKGNFEEAMTILQAAVREVEKNPRLPDWVGAYSRFYYGMAYLKLGEAMESKGIAQVLVKRRYSSAVKAFKDFKEKHTEHRLQLDFPVPYATALMKMGKDEYDEALSNLENVKIESRNQYARLRLYQAMKIKGDILNLKGNHDQALDSYKELLRRMPSEKVIDEVMAIKQDVSVFIGTTILDKAEQSSDGSAYRDAEEYFRKILKDVSATGIAVTNMGRVYLSIGKCRQYAKDWEGAMWYFLHGCIAYFDDNEVHRDSLYNVIVCLDEMIMKENDAKKKKQFKSELKEYYRQLKTSHGATPEAMKARKIYNKYKDS